VGAVGDKAAAAAAAQPGAPAAPPASAFDVAKFAGIFAAIGLAVGAIGTAIAAVVKGFLGLSLGMMPVAVLGALLVISGPSMLLAAMKLRLRSVGPLLEANGWAINARARVNIPFGKSLTRMPVLPAGSRRDLVDPYAEKASPWPRLLVVLLVLVLLLWGAWKLDWLDQVLPKRMRHAAVAMQPSDSHAPEVVFGR
jgi:hypothetical protein